MLINNYFLSTKPCKCMKTSIISSTLYFQKLTSWPGGVPGTPLHWWWTLSLLARGGSGSWKPLKGELRLLCMCCCCMLCKTSLVVFLFFTSNSYNPSIMVINISSPVKDLNLVSSIWNLMLQESESCSLQTSVIDNAVKTKDESLPPVSKALCLSHCSLRFFHISFLLMHLERWSPAMLESSQHEGSCEIVTG